MGFFSRQPTETKVFTPSSPVNISPGLLSQLVSTKETDFTRQQLNDKFLEEKVAQRYAQREEETLKKFEVKLNSALLKDSAADEQELSSSAVQQKVASLTERLAQLETRTKPKANKEVADARGQVARCLAANEGRPLNCYEEIQQFKKVAL